MITSSEAKRAQRDLANACKISQRFYAADQADEYRGHRGCTDTRESLQEIPSTKYSLCAFGESTFNAINNRCSFLRSSCRRHV